MTTRAGECGAVGLLSRSAFAAAGLFLGARGTPLAMRDAVTRAKLVALLPLLLFTACGGDVGERGERVIGKRHKPARTWTETTLTRQKYEVVRYHDEEEWIVVLEGNRQVRVDRNTYRRVRIGDRVTLSERGRAATTPR